MAKRQLVAKDVKSIITTLKSDDVDDTLSLARRRELSDAAEQLEAHTRDYVQHGRRYADAVFESLNDVVGGLIMVLKDRNDEAKAAEPSQQPVASASAAPVTTPVFSDIASTMARLEARLNTINDSFWMEIGLS